MTDQSTLATTQHLAPPTAEVSPQAFRSAFRRHPSGVAILTALGPTGPIGTTVTSVRSLSATPPLLAVSLNRTASVWPGLAAAPRFLVHLLGATQAPLAERFATSGVDRFAAPTRWSADGTGLPRLADAAVVLTCEKTHQLPFGEADLLVARIVGVEHGPAEGPLLHHDGAYHRLTSP